MPKLKHALPKYRRHKASGQAVVTIAGTDHYLGKYRTKVSRTLYNRLVGEWQASGRKGPPSEPDALTVTELIHRFWCYAKEHYRHPDGSPTGAAEVFKPTLRMLRQLYGDVPVNEFGPKSLKRLQRVCIEQGNGIGYINDRVNRIRRVFRWGVSEELVDESTYRRLQTVDGLRPGRSEAKQAAPILPVDDDIVEQTLPHLPPIVAHMVQIQHVTGVRPGEICIMRPGDIDTSGDVWVFTPQQHKTQHHGKRRLVPIGPQAQAILSNYMDRDPSEYCFNPAETIEKHLESRHAQRVTPISQGNKPKRRRRKSKAGEHYTNDSYRRAIHRGCDRAFPPPEPLALREGESNVARLKRLTDDQQEQLAKWQADHRWSPNQLRHSMATKIRAAFGIEAVAASLGHSRTDTSEIYAARNLKLAMDVAMQLG